MPVIGENKYSGARAREEFVCQSVRACTNEGTEGPFFHVAAPQNLITRF